MNVVVDTHGHIDPRHDIGMALRHAALNLRGLAPDPQTDLAIVLTERDRQGLFDLLADPARQIRGVSVHPCKEEGALRAVVADVGAVAIIAGRQIVTSERLEVLALATRAALPADGVDLAAAVRAVLDGGGFPVVPWSPGKWLGARGRLVAALLEKEASVGLADSGLRPRGLQLPSLIQQGMRSGRPVLAGSDPLPLAGEEQRLGSYATLWAGGWDRDRPAAALLALLRGRTAPPRWVGVRCSLAGLTWRLLRLSWRTRAD